MNLNKPEPIVGGSGPDSDVVVSSRVRLARNIAGFPFVNKASDPQRHEILNMVRRCRFPEKTASDMIWVDMMQATPHDRQLLVERHLISKQFADESSPRGVAITSDETISIMVNEEDHLRIQSMVSGFGLQNAFGSIDEFDRQLAESMDFAFDERWGYLTACPTNVGCGIRLSVMLHLPAIRMSNELDRVKRAAQELHLAVRGSHGEGSEVRGDFYQISNQVTLGRSEEELLDDFCLKVVPALVNYERSAREKIMDQKPELLDDRVHRARAVLQHARLLGTDESLKLLSRVALGVCLERFNDLELPDVHRLFLQIQPSHLRSSIGDPQASDETLRIARANLVRAALSGTG